jgi:hypothetical protein
VVFGEDRVRRDRRVDGVAAGPEHAEARGRGEVVGGDDGAVRPAGERGGHEGATDLHAAIVRARPRASTDGTIVSPA